VSITVLIAVAAVLTSAQHPVATSTIRIAVVDDAGAPIAGAEVYLDGQNVDLRRSALAGADGVVRFDGLPAGTFFLHAQKSGYLERIFGMETGAVVPISLAAGDSFAATLTLPRAGSISGTVVDADGRPAQAIVRVRLVTDPGRGTRGTRTSADGSYRIDDLDPGDYVVSAIGPNIAIRDGAKTGRLIYVPVFFHGTTSAASATRITVHPGAPTTAIDLQLQLRPIARLEGVVLDPQGQPAAGVVVQLERSDDDGSGNVTVRTSKAGTFETPLIPATYKLTAQGGAAMEVVAAAGTTTQVTVPQQRPARIAGRLRLAAVPAPGLSSGVVVLSLVPRATSPGAGGAVPIRIVDPAAATVAAESVPPGEYRVELAPALGGWMIEAVAADGRELIDGTLRVRPGAGVIDLSATLSTPATMITGTIVDGDGAPVFRHRIVIMSANRADWVPGSRRVASAQPDTKGRFAVRGLPPGAYLLAALDGASRVDFDPTLLEAAAAQALRIVLPPGGRVVQDIRIAR
jgi:hypothetical protein